MSTKPSKVAWHRLAAQESPSGWRLETAIQTLAPDVSLPLDVTGIHAIHIGVYMPDTLMSGVLVRLDDDPYFASGRVCVVRGASSPEAGTRVRRRP